VPTEPHAAVPPAALTGADAIVRRMQALQGQASIEIVAIGVSTGGPQALTEVLPHLPADLGVPVVIVQHMPQTFTGALAASLNDKSAVTVVEGENGQMLEAGVVYIAPGGKQMKIVQQSPRQAPNLLMTDDPPENYCKPSVDYLFRSVAHLYANRALGVIMTGMGSDGVLGLRLMKQQGAKILAQDAETCVVFGMPMEAIKAGVVDAVVPLGQLATAIVHYIGRR
jgi:two-component system chemotaxis response regulator CheB